MKWESIRLGELIDVKHGWAFKGEYFADSGDLVLLTPGNCYESGGLKLRADKEKFYSGEFPDEYLLRKGDLLIVMTDLVGTAPVLGGAFVIPEDDRYLHNQRLGLVTVTDDSRLDKCFLYWLLNSNDYRAQVRGSASGATVRHTSPGRVKNVVVRLPSELAYQREIARVLFAHDDLIDNNRRRIQLLEDSVRLVFDEWFVRRRYPGTTLTTESGPLPAGWSQRPLQEVLWLQRGFDLPIQDREDGAVPIYAASGVNGYHNVAKVRGPGVVTGRAGSLGQVQFVHEDFWPLNTTLWVKEFRTAPPRFSLHLLRSMALERYGQGATMPMLDRKVVHQVNVVLPPDSAMQEFEALAIDVYDQIRTLQVASEKLRAARDLLLPRLMSGELTV